MVLPLTTAISCLTLGILLASRVDAFGPSTTVVAGRHDAGDLISTRSLQQVTALEPITLRGGVLVATPFAIANDDGTYSGFQGDLLHRLSAFALADD